jgi:mannosyltransferase
MTDVIAGPRAATGTAAAALVRRRPAWLMPLLVACPGAGLVVGLTLPGLSARPLWHDEYITWYAATLSPGDLIRLLRHIDAVLGPYYAFMHGWVSVFGDSEASLRLPSVLALAAAAGLTSVVGARLFGPWTGTAAGLLFAVLPGVSRYGQEARPYGLAVLGTVLATLLLLRAFDRPSWSRWAWYAAALFGIGLAHCVALTVVIPHALAVYLAARQRRDFRIWRWAAVVVAAASALLPIIAKGSQQSAAISWIEVNWTNVVQFPGRVFGGAAVATLVIAVALLAAGMQRRTNGGTILVLLTWALGPVLFCLVTFPVLHLFLYRYLLFTLPAWCLLAAGLAPMLARRMPGQAWLATPFAAVVIALVGYVGVPAHHAVRQQAITLEPDFRAAAAMVAANVRDGDGIAYVQADRNGRYAFAYELRDRPRPRDVFVATSSQQLGTFGVAECKEPVRCLGDTKRIWLVAAAPGSAGTYSPMPRAIAQLLRDTFVSEQRWTFTDVTVVLLTRHR